MASVKSHFFCLFVWYVCVRALQCLANYTSKTLKRRSPDSLAVTDNSALHTYSDHQSVTMQILTPGH